MSVQRSHSTHESHDQLLVARLAGNDVTPAERADAEELVAACGECSALFADLRSIMADLSRLPAPERPRDFRLTDSDAERLQRRGILGRFRPSAVVRRDSRRGLVGALGGAMAALGLAGILVSGATTLIPQASPTQLYGVGQTTGANDSQSKLESQRVAPAAAPASEPAGGPSPAGTAVASSEVPPLVGAVSSPGASASAASLPGARPGTAGAAPTAAPSAGAGTFGSPAASGFQGPGAGTHDQTTAASSATSMGAYPSVERAPAPSAPSPPIVPIASAALLVVGIGLLVVARASARPF